MGFKHKNQEGVAMGNLVSDKKDAERQIGEIIKELCKKHGVESVLVELDRRLNFTFKKEG